MEGVEQALGRAARRSRLRMGQPGRDGGSRADLHVVRRRCFGRRRANMTAAASAPGSLAVSMVSGQPVHVPFELVGFDLRAGTQWDHASYKMTTVGLGAGAFAGGRRAACLARGRRERRDCAGRHVWPARRIHAARRSIAAGDHPALDDLVAKVESAGLDCFFVDVTGHVALPTVAAFVTTPGETHAGSGMRSFAGFACRLVGRGGGDRGLARGRPVAAHANRRSARRPVA